MPEPSITYWNRLEPRPRSDGLERTLAAELRDPAWLLARQWQLGEMQGEDAASLAFVELRTRTSGIRGWKVGGVSVAGGGDPSIPPERKTLAEPYPVDLSLRAELGAIFLQLLREANASDAEVEAVLAGFALDPLEEHPFDPVDPSAERFFGVCRGRLPDGVKAYAAAEGSAALPSGVPRSDNVLQALEQLKQWAREVFGELKDAPADPPAWVPERLEYDVTAEVDLPGGGTVKLRARPDADGDLDWDSFDLEPAAVAPGAPPDSDSEAVSLHIPADLRFRGMPNARFWDFETGATDFGDVRPDLRDVPKLLVVDFALVHGVDWFVLPLEVPLGSLVAVESLVAHDVFGDATRIPAADSGSSTARWSLFRTSVAGDPAAIPPAFLFLPPSAGSALETGLVIEEVGFARDETANMVWAVERITPNDLGEPRPGAERYAAAKTGSSPASPPAADGAPRYRIETEVPVHWIPFLPVVVDQETGAVDLAKAAMQRSKPPSKAPELVPAAGRLLAPFETRFLREEEVPRSGVSVQRVLCRTRWIDGSTHLWVTRRKRAGSGETWSGLRFDTAE